MTRTYRLSPEGLEARRRSIQRPEVRAKMSAASKAALADPAVRAKMSAASKAALADPAVRAKMSAARKAALADPAVRAKMSAASKAAWADPAVRAKMSAARKAAWADPAVRAKMSAARKAALADPAVRAKISAGLRARLAVLTPHGLKVYRKLISCGIERERALTEAVKANNESEQQQDQRGWRCRSCRVVNLDEAAKRCIRCQTKRQPAQAQGLQQGAPAA